MRLHYFGFIIVFLALVNKSWLVELTFELADNAKECFHEQIKNETKGTLEFQVNSSICVSVR